MKVDLNKELAIRASREAFSHPARIFKRLNAFPIPNLDKKLKSQMFMTKKF